MPTVTWSSPWPATEDNVRRFVVKASGVYVLRKLAAGKSLTVGDFLIADSSRAVIYVGQAESLETRMLQHVSPSEANECLKRYIRQGADMTWAPVSSKADRDCIERALYDHYAEPECNEVAPPGKACSVNFPF